MSISMMPEKSGILDDYVEKISPRWIVRFRWHNDRSDRMASITTSLQSLYANWMGDAEMCPENGEYIYDMILSDGDGKCFLLEDRGETTFEEFMQQVGEVSWYVEGNAT